MLTRKKPLRLLISELGQKDTFVKVSTDKFDLFEFAMFWIALIMYLGAIILLLWF